MNTSIVPEGTVRPAMTASAVHSPLRDDDDAPYSRPVSNIGSRERTATHSGSDMAAELLPHSMGHEEDGARSPREEAVLGSKKATPTETSAMAPTPPVRHHSLSLVSSRTASDTRNDSDILVPYSETGGAPLLKTTSLPASKRQNRTAAPAPAPAPTRGSSTMSALSAAYNRILERFVDNDVEEAPSTAVAEQIVQTTATAPISPTPDAVHQEDAAGAGAVSPPAALRNKRGSIRKTSDKSLFGVSAVAPADPASSSVKKTSNVVSPFAIARGMEDGLDEEAYGTVNLPTIPSSSTIPQWEVVVQGEDGQDINGEENALDLDLFDRPPGNEDGEGERSDPDEDSEPPINTTMNYDTIGTDTMGNEDEDSRLRARVLAVMRLSFMCLYIGVFVSTLSVVYMAACMFWMESFHPTAFGDISTAKQWIYMITQYFVACFWVPMPYVIIRFVFSADLVPKTAMYASIAASCAVLVYLIAMQATRVYDPDHWYFNIPPYVASLVTLVWVTRVVSSDQVIAVIQMIRRNFHRSVGANASKKPSTGDPSSSAGARVSRLFASNSHMRASLGSTPAWAHQLSAALGGANLLASVSGQVPLQATRGRSASTVSTMANPGSNNERHPALKQSMTTAKKKRKSCLSALREWWKSPKRVLAVALVTPIAIGIIYALSFQVAVAEWYSQTDTSDTQRRLYIILVIPAASYVVQQLSMNACKSLPKILLPNAWALATLCLLVVALSKRLLLAALDDVSSIALFTSIVELGQLISNLTVDLRAALIYRLRHGRAIPLSHLKSSTRFVFLVQFFTQRLIVDYASTLVAGFSLIMVHFAYFENQLHSKAFVWRIISSMVVQLALQVAFSLPYLWLLCRRDSRKFRVMYDQRRQLTYVCAFLMFTAVVAASTQMIQAMQKNVIRVYGYNATGG